MKRFLSIVAVAVFALGLFSCEAETDVQETADLLASLDQEANDENEKSEDDRQ
ncbi:hypothetical protein [Flagellimonas meishanensis]|uniref:hypothetical protein n=1 Tax=Flagellimonas meishanensis TaxID=2873264 RepID=UPI001CA6722D|nr:hypothetical protein [[Muricauda] meishanensis]